MRILMIAEQAQIVEHPRALQPIADQDEIAISVHGVGKMYRIYDHPQDRLKQMLWRGRRMYGREFWALRDISFEVKKGETVGIVGRNGSGKSTLLQIIAGTLNPTEGVVDVYGRVAALLELGSGFNPEFTGRENVFLNGSILGISREEMQQRFDDIAAFADIGEFIEQPVKLYSSGMVVRMVVRLAFAVQAFVPKEILIVDEALAVGDMFFQAKCMAQIKRLLDDGITVLFVSHDTGAVKSLCRRALLLDHGQMIENSTADIVAERYYSLKVRSEQPILGTIDRQADGLDRDGDTEYPDTAFMPSADFLKRATFQRLQNGKAHFLNVQLLDQYGSEVVQVEYDQKVTLRLAIQVTADISDRLAFGYHIRDSHGVDLVYSDSMIEQADIVAPRIGDRYVADWTFRAALHAGNYSIAVGMSIPIDLQLSLVDRCDFIPLAIQFYVEPRRESYLYGAVHWDNLVRVQRHGTRVDV
jgi:lipopolysaccharide transport system ATP-binding protein